MDAKISKTIIDTIRTLSMDAVQKANSGHPGTPMALAPLAYLLFDKFLNYDPKNPDWFNRDRFILSAGHASMLLYSILHLTGYKVSLEEIENFRQLGSITPGHPEYGLTDGVETTTGPLGQGAANSVGMAIARKWLGAKYNKPDYEIISYKVTAIVSDGDLMEGISSEAASMAGHLKLDDLVWIYDSNRITIDGSTDLTFSEDVKKRFESYNWKVLNINDANDLYEIEKVITKAIQHKGSPTLVILDSHIGYGSPNKQDTASAHGTPLGEDEVILAKDYYGVDPEKKFYVPDELDDFKLKKLEHGRKVFTAWNNLFNEYEKKFEDEARELIMIINGEIPAEAFESVNVFKGEYTSAATRVLNGKVLNSVAGELPWLIGGSADLSESNNIVLKNEESFGSENYSGRNIHYGVREHVMGGISNGLALNKLRPFTGTFLIFSDYMRPSIRLAALMKLPVNFIFTHDSIGLGEDGPTHQPVEQLASLRLIPNLDVFRPADGAEIEVMWQYILSLTDRPVASVLTRQKVPVIDRQKYNSAADAIHGGYVIADSENPEVILIATGSEVHLCLEAHEELKSDGIQSRVVSMPCVEEFERQHEEYKNSVLPYSVKERVSVEAGVTSFLQKYIGDNGVSIGINSFGESAPWEDLYNHFGITKEKIIQTVKTLMREDL